MKQFPYAHAAHPDWRLAAALVLAQLRAQMATQVYAKAPTLALLYITDHYANLAKNILGHLSHELPEVTDWSGTVGVGVAANNVEYFDEPAMAVMLCDVTPDQYRVFSGVAPLGLGFEAYSALVHADGNTPDLPELIAEMAGRTASGYLFGGLAASRKQAVHFAIGGNGNIRGHGGASGVFSGGLSGVAFGEEVALISRVTQGCQPVSQTRLVTRFDDNVATELDGEPALDVMLRDLDVSLAAPQKALERVRQTLVGLVDANEGPNDAALHDAARASRRRAAGFGDFGSDVTVRHIIGLDPARRGVAVSAHLHTGMQLAFCQRNVQAARADLVRICAEIREELDTSELPLSPVFAEIQAQAPPSPPPRQIAGAIYVSCSGRGGPHFGGKSAELQIVRRALGDVPLVGFFAGGEIARHHLYGYTGVLTVFTTN